MPKKHENKSHILNDNDIGKLFALKPKAKRSLWHFLWYVLIFIAIFIVVFVVANFSSLTKQFDFWYQDNYGANTIDPKLISLEASLQNEDYTESFIETNKPVFEDNKIYIPEVYIDAPIIWNVNNIENETDNKLEEGTIHLAGTALPGQQGNVFVTGHSSNYIWSPGSYKDVFSLLDKLVIGDFAYVNYQNKTFIYQIEEIKVVKPTDLTVLNQEGEGRLTLVTCTPVGTSINRLVLVAKQIYPSKDINTESLNSGDLNSLPPIR